jgi:hypothetical protein
VDAADEDAAALLGQAEALAQLQVLRVLADHADRGEARVAAGAAIVLEDVF